MWADWKSGGRSFRHKLKEAEAKAANLLKGELETLVACEHHFHSWCRQRREGERVEKELPPNAVLVQLDAAGLNRDLDNPDGADQGAVLVWADD